MYIKRYFSSHPNILQFKELLTSENSDVTRKLACYVFKGFQIRYNIYKHFFSPTMALLIKLFIMYLGPFNTYFMISVQ